MTKENPATTEWVGLRPGTSLYPNVTRTMALMLAAAGAYTLFSVYLALQTPTWQLIGQTVLMVLYCLAAVAAGWWARRGRLTAAGLTVIGALLPTTLGITALIEGLGLVMGVIAVTLTALVAALSLPRRLTPRLIWLSVAAGLAAVLGDLYLPLPWVRGQVPALRVAAPLIAGLLAAAYILLVARQFRHYSLRTKLIITFVVVTVLPVAAVGYLTDRAARVALTASADQTLLASAAQTAGRLDAFIEQWSNEVRNEATYADFVDYLALPADQRSGSAAEARARTLLRALGRKDDANIASYALLDATGLNVLDTLASRRGLDESGRSYFREPFQSGAIYVSPIEISMSTGEPVLYFSAPVRDLARNVIGVLRAQYRATLLQRLVAQSGQLVTEDALAMVVDEDLIALVHSKLPDLTLRSIVPLSADRLAALQAAARLPAGSPAAAVVELPTLAQNLAQLDTQPSFATRLDPDGTDLDQRAGAARMTTRPWIVIVAVPGAVVLAPADAQTRVTVLVGVTVAVLAGLLAVLVAQFTASPIVRLTASAARVSAGDLTVQVPVESDDEIGALATTFNVMTTQLREALEGLEKRVADRTRALAASAEVSRRLAVIADEPTLIKAVVDEIRAAFGYYHVHAYLWDERREALVLAGGTGEAGQALLARGHRLARGRGLVGQAAETNTVVLVSDTAANASWMPNPLLPDTRAEAAVPISLGAEVLGVLDTQHDVVGGITPEDAELLQAIANQVAVALQNARAYRATQQAVAREAQVTAINQQILSTTTVADALQVAVREVGRALGGRPARARLTPEGPNGQPERAGA